MVKRLTAYKADRPLQKAEVFRQLSKSKGEGA
jgi:hypothetical protein